MKYRYCGDCRRCNVFGLYFEKSKNMILIEELIKSDPDDLELIALAEEAKLFIEGHKWCRSVEKQWLAKGWENILLVFFFEIVPNTTEADDKVWVIVGDLPPAYIRLVATTKLAKNYEIWG